jgi:glycosyltransferase involved in cell wall biosynthesis
MRLDDRLIAGSTYTAQAYRRLGYPVGPLHRIPYGVDVEEFVPQLGDREAFGLHDDDFVVIMVAYVYAPKSAVFRGIGIKGHDVILAGWRDIVAAEPRAHLLLIGGGFDAAGEAHRVELMDRHQVDGDETITWLASVEDVRPYYAVADLSVSPSLSENHGAVLEASAMAVPSVVSDAGALPETVTADTGWVVPAGRAAELVSAVVAAGSERRDGRLGERGHRARDLMRERFDQGHCADEVSVVVLSAGSPCDRVTLRQRLRGGRRRPVIAAFSEQRAWVDSGQAVGRKGLDLVSALANESALDVELNVRIGTEESGGVVLAPGSDTRSLVSGSPGLVGSVRELACNVWRVLAAVRGADVVCADQPGIIGGLGLAAGRLMGRPLVVNVVGDSEESVHPDVVPGLRGRVAHRLLPAVQRWTVGRASVVNYVTQQVLQGRYPAACAAQTFAISTTGPLGPARPRRFPRGVGSLVSVASLEQPYKGVSELIEAVAVLGRSGTEVRLTVIGEGRLRCDLERLAARAAPGQVTFTGHLYGADL